FNEGGLKRRFDPGYSGEVNVTLELLLVLRLKVELFNAVTANNDYPRLLRVGGIYEHFVGHYVLSPRRGQTDATADLRGIHALFLPARRNIWRSHAQREADLPHRPRPRRRGFFRSGAGSGLRSLRYMRNH